MMDDAMTQSATVLDVMMAGRGGVSGPVGRKGVKVMIDKDGPRSITIRLEGGFAAADVLAAILEAVQGGGCRLTFGDSGFSVERWKPRDGARAH